MKIKTLISFGVFFFILQFTTVMVYNQMLSIAESHKLPIRELQNYQQWIMWAFLGFLIVFSILFLVLLLSVIIRSWRSLRPEHGEVAASGS